MSLPTPYAIQHEAYLAGAEDAHGNPVVGYAPAVDVLVHGWAPPSGNTEPFEAGRNAVLRDLDIYAPAGTVMAPRDRVTVAGVVHEVVGYVEDFTTGPWQWAAGVRISAKRVEG